MLHNPLDAGAVSSWTGLWWDDILGNWPDAAPLSLRGNEWKAMVRRVEDLLAVIGW